VRVLIVSAHGADPTYGGAERYVSELASGIGARGYEVAVLSAFPQRGEPGVETHVLHRTDWRDSQARRLRNHVGDLVSAPWPRLGALLQATSPDLVHTNNLPGIGTGVWEAARRADIPVVHTLHDYYLLCPRTTLTRRDASPCRPHPLLCGARTRRLARWHEAVGAVIGVSEHVVRVHRHLFPGAAKHVVRPPVRSFGAPPKPPNTPPRTFGYMGALTPTKGIALLLAAAPSFAREGLTLGVAGDGPMRREVETAEHIRYEGHLQGAELTAFMRSCDAGLVPSLWEEPGPLVLSEWLGAGRPVLATRRGGLAEAARDGGVITVPESPEAFVAAALHLRNRDEWRRLLATLPAVDDCSHLGRWLNEHEAVYEAAAGRTASLATA
jgi:glycosyltransferase involved in cell wall biosynthesis